MIDNNFNQLSIDEIKSRIVEIYEKLRLLSFNLMQLNIDQYDGKISKEDANIKLTKLANEHIELDTELFQLQKVLKIKESENAEKIK